MLNMDTIFNGEISENNEAKASEVDELVVSLREMKKTYKEMMMDESVDPRMAQAFKALMAQKLEVIQLMLSGNQVKLKKAHSSWSDQVFWFFLYLSSIATAGVDASLFEIHSSWALANLGMKVVYRSKVYVSVVYLSPLVLNNIPHRWWRG